MRQLLGNGVPFVVNNVKVSDNFNPTYFINKYYGEECDIVYVDEGRQAKTTVNDFFRTFGHTRPTEARAKLKASFVPCIRFLYPELLVGLATRGQHAD